MTPLGRALRLALLTCIAIPMVLGALPAVAQEVASTVVGAGDSAIIDRGPKPFIPAGGSKGTAVPVASGAAPNSYALLYFAPAGSADLDDLVQYKAGDSSRAMHIRVQTVAPPLSGDIYTKSSKALFILFVLAILVENGLALLFRWRPFLDYFDTRSVNPLVALGLSLLLVMYFNLDITTGLLNIYAGTNVGANGPGILLTAMIIAGGSAGVNRIFRALGFRPVSADSEPLARPPLDKAWIAVRLGIASKAVGTIAVLIGPQGTPTAAGTINAGSGRMSRLLAYFIRDRHRFPPSGGYVVAPGGPYEVRLEGKDAAGNPLSAGWGPYAIAQGAIIDAVLAP